MAKNGSLFVLSALSRVCNPKCVVMCLSACSCRTSLYRISISVFFYTAVKLGLQMAVQSEVKKFLLLCGELVVRDLIKLSKKFRNYIFGMNWYLHFYFDSNIKTTEIEILYKKKLLQLQVDKHITIHIGSKKLQI